MKKKASKPRIRVDHSAHSPRKCLRIDGRCTASFKTKSTPHFGHHVLERIGNAIENVFLYATKFGKNVRTATKRLSHGIPYLGKLV